MDLAIGHVLPVTLTASENTTNKCPTSHLSSPGQEIRRDLVRFFAHQPGLAVARIGRIDDHIVLLRSVESTGDLPCEIQNNEFGEVVAIRHIGLNRVAES